jgi:Holliday junction resolvase RusA-like endonuclease
MDSIIVGPVYGVPSPQAGMRSVPVRAKGGKVVGTRQVTTGGVGLLNWRQAVADAAHAAALVSGKLDGPVRLEVLLRFPLPKSAPRWAHQQAMVPHTGTPDADKLLRAIGDSLKAGGLVADDARFHDVHTLKVKCAGWSGTLIRVTPEQAQFWTLPDEWSHLWTL